MTKSNEKLATVQKSIDSAVRASNTMLENCRKAAQAAAAQLDTKFALKERIDAVVSMYDFQGNNNVKSNFKDMLTLLACETSEVTVKIKGEDTIVKAADAVKLGKHSVKDAVKQVRDEKGIGRKTTPRNAPKAQKAEAAKPSKPVALTTEQLHAPILSSVNVRFESDDATFIDKLIAVCKKHGYTLAKN